MPAPSPSTPPPAPEDSAPDGAARAADSATVPAVDPATDTAPPRKRELPSRRNTSVRNLVWAVGLNLLIVAVVAVAVVGLGRGNGGTGAADNAAVIDVSDSAARASDVLGFTAAAPDLGADGWVARSAEALTTEPPSWRVRYTSPDGALVTLVQQGDASSTLTSSIGGSVRVQEETEVAGVACQWLAIDGAGADGGDGRDGAATERVGLGCAGEGHGVVVFGGESRENIRALMQSALESGG
ncbi:MAG: DUF4245 family protein [Dermabacter sp.]|nr:DUF4245 family protein [Dermabacter sp.]